MSARRPDLIIINNNNKKRKKKKKRTYKIVDFAVLADHRIKLKESEKKYLNLARELKKSVEHEGDNYTNCNWCVWNRITKGTGGFGSWRTGRDYPNDSIAENGQNPETSPGDLRRLLSLRLQWKTISLHWCEKSKGVNNNNNNNNNALGTTKSLEKINHLMYIDDIKIFTKNEKELETLIQTIRIYNQHIEMEFRI